MAATAVSRILCLGRTVSAIAPRSLCSATKDDPTERKRQKRSRKSSVSINRIGELDLLLEPPMDGPLTSEMRTQIVENMALSLRKAVSTVLEILESSEQFRRTDIRVVEKNLSCLLSYYSGTTISKFPSSMLIPWRSVEHRRRILREIEAKNASWIFTLMSFNDFNHTTLFQLNKMNVIDWYNNAERFIDNIHNCTAETADRIRSLLDRTTSAQLTLHQYRALVIEEYLKVTFGIDNVWSEENYRLNYHSLDLISKRVEILLKDLNLKPKFILKNPSLLIINTQNMEEIVATVPNLSTFSLRDVVSWEPRILSVPAGNLRFVDTILKENCVPPDTIRRWMRIFLLDPKVISACVEKAQPIYLAQGSPDKLISYIVRYGLQRHMVHHSGLSTKRAYMSASDVRACLAYELDVPEPFVKTRMERAAQPVPRLSTRQDVRDFRSEVVTEFLSFEQLRQTPELFCFSIEELRKTWADFPKQEYSKVLGPRWTTHPLLGEMIFFEALKFRKTRSSDL